MSDNLLLWISQNSQWAALIVLSIAFFESLVIIGLVIPGWVLLVGVGVLIGNGNLPFLTIVLASFVGAVLGESLSYYLGWHHRERIHQWQFFTKHPHWLINSQKFFKRHGAASVALGRFFGPVRAFVPLVAGASDMPPLRFTLINVASALIWAPAYLLPGVIAGAAIDVSQETSVALIVGFSAIAIFSWLLAKFSIQIYQHKQTYQQQKGNSDPFIAIAFLPLLKAVTALTCLTIVGKLLFFGVLSNSVSELFHKVWAIVLSA